jgi:hypothetical protein
MYQVRGVALVREDEIMILGSILTDQMAFVPMWGLLIVTKHYFLLPIQVVVPIPSSASFIGFLSSLRLQILQQVVYSCINENTNSRCQVSTTIFALEEQLKKVKEENLELHLIIATLNA